MNIELVEQSVDRIKIRRLVSLFLNKDKEKVKNLIDKIYQSAVVKFDDYIQTKNGYFDFLVDDLKNSDPETLSKTFQMSEDEFIEEFELEVVQVIESEVYKTIAKTVESYVTNLRRDY